MAPLSGQGMPLLGKLLRRFRAGEARSPLAGPEYAGAVRIDVTSPAFTDGGAITVITPDLGGLGEGELKPGTTGVRLIKAFGDTYLGPRPIPGHGAHHYRFLVFALDRAVPDSVADHRALLSAIAGHVVARGVLTGTYER